MHFDEKYMKVAIDLAKKGSHKSFPNPSVGSVLVECNQNYTSDKIVGFGMTQKGGRPHAEYEAIKDVNFNKKKIYICYTTLEPCFHKGRDIPCSELIIKKKINEVVFSISDPDMRTTNKSKNAFERNKINVRHGILKSETLNFYDGYFLNKLKSRPKVTLKIASSMNGKIFDSQNPKLWITNRIARLYSHYQRLEHDGILIGSNTAKIDNPRLTCRIRGMSEYSPIRFIINRKLNLSVNLKIFKIKDKKTFLISISNSMNKKKSTNYRDVNHIFLKENQNIFKTLLKELVKLGISRLIVEGGSILNTLFLKHKIVDEIVIHRGNFFMDEKSMNILNPITRYENLIMKNFNLLNVFCLGNNHIETYESNNLKKFKLEILRKF